MPTPEEPVPRPGPADPPVDAAGERARLARKTRALGLLAAAGTRLLVEDSPDGALRDLLEEATALFELDVYLHFSASEDGRRLLLQSCRGVDDRARATITHLPASDAFCGSVASGSGPVTYTGVQARTDAGTAWVRAIGLQAYACFPLLSSSGLHGMLAFGSRRRDAFDRVEMQFLHAVRDQVAAAMARARAASALVESQQRLLEAAAIAQLGTFETNVRTDAIVVNEQGRRIYGWGPDEPLTFARVQKQFHPEDRDRVLRAIAEARDPFGPGIFEVEQRIVRTDGATRWIRVRGRVVFEGRAADARPLRAVGTFIDITDRKEAEERRERMLEQERRAREDAERLGRLKDEFLATISHELRTPLNAILGWLQLMRRKSMSADDTRRAFETIDRNARAQAQLIDDLLDMSRIISGRLRIELRPVDLSLIVSMALESVQPGAEVKRIRVQHAFPDGDTFVLGDAARLQQVVWNLLSNAVKFTPADGRVDVTLTRAGGQVELSVVDSGPGIAPDFLPHIFEPFRQEDSSTTRRHAGVGLGLSIAKHLLDLHGATLRAHNVEGGGAAFTVTLQAAPAAGRWLPADAAHAGTPPAASRAESPPSPLAGLTVLVVEDEPDALDLQRRVLEDAGAAVLTASSAAEAVAALERRAVDVLVSDIGMPRIDGYELLRNVRRLSHPLATALPAIAVSAYAREEDRAAALAAGYALHLAKPTDAQQLVQAVLAIAPPPGSRRRDAAPPAP